MSILFKMIRLGPGAFEYFEATGRVPAAYRGEADEGVDQAWDILARILAAGPPLAADAITGGRVLPYGDMDYGGMRIHGPDDVIAISRALGELTVEDIGERYRDVDFTDAFKADGARPAYPPDEIVAAFDALRDFYAETAGMGAAMLIYVH